MRHNRLSVAVERAPIGARDVKEFVLNNIPMPPSVNNLFFNVEGGGRRKSSRYMTWRNAAGWEIRAQTPRRVRGPVDLFYTFEEGGTKADLGNLEKGATDLLVDLGLIDGDGPAIVRSITLCWGKVVGLRIEVRRAGP
jgi:Holliday junction resolvase RusA-like endonuclease